MNAIFRTSLIATLALVSMPLAARAQSPAAPAEIQIFNAPVDQQPTDEQLKKLFDVMRLRDQMASMTKSMSAIMQQATQQQLEQLQKDHPELNQMNDEQKQQAAKVMARFTERVLAAYTGDDMINEMQGIYKRHLTREDVDALIAIYNTPAGQHMLAMAPAVMQELMPSMMAHMQEKMRPILAEMEQELKAIAPQAAAPKQ